MFANIINDIYDINISEYLHYVEILPNADFFMVGKFVNWGSKNIPISFHNLPKLNSG
jgi:hypothetical protein